jgi:hypothetical protein
MVRHREGQWPEQDGVHHGEDGQIGAETQGERRQTSSP